jgi:DNA-binding response OmpR family regulator
MLMEDILEELGYQTVTAVTFDEAMAKAPTVEADVALLDIDLSGESSMHIAEILHARGIPLAFATALGAAVDGLKPLSQAPVITKPFSIERLQEVLSTLVKDRVNDLD